MDPPKTLTAILGFDENEWLDRSWQYCTRGANASGSRANQVAWDDRRLPAACVHAEAEGSHDTSSAGRAQASTSYQGLDTSIGSESQAVFVKAGNGSGPSQRKRATKSVTEIRCEVANCPHPGTFNRIYDLQRHILDIHQGRAREKCPVIHCELYFGRYDKLWPHLQKVHDDTDIAICPLPQCQMQIPFLLVPVHMECHGPEKNFEGVAWRACRMLPIGTRGCPVPIFKRHTKRILAGDMQEHLIKHRAFDVEKNSAGIKAAGYCPTTLLILCPLCATRSPTLAQFQVHFEDAHLSTKGWLLRYVRQTLLDRRRSDASGILFYSFWSKQPLGYQIISELRQRPLGLIIDLMEQYGTSFHVHLLKPYDELSAPGVMDAAIKLWPELGYHPLFDSWMPPVTSRVAS